MESIENAPPGRQSANDRRASATASAPPVVIRAPSYGVSGRTPGVLLAHPIRIVATEGPQRQRNTLRSAGEKGIFCLFSVWQSVKIP